MKKCAYSIIFLICVLAFGCAYKVPSNISPAVNIYSSYGDKMPGGVVLVMDDSIYNINRDLKPSSYLCSVHKFPINIDETLGLSIRQTTEAIFEEVVEQKTMPNTNQFENLNCKGVLFVKLKRFYPNIRFFKGFWSSQAIATCNLILEITAKDANNNKLLVTTVGGDRTMDGDGGQACAGGATVLGESINKAIKETMERYAERISNSRKIRNCFAGQE